MFKIFIQIATFTLCLIDFRINSKRTRRVKIISGLYGADAARLLYNVIYLRKVPLPTSLLLNWFESHELNRISYYPFVTHTRVLTRQIPFYNLENWRKGGKEVPRIMITCWNYDKNTCIQPSSHEHIDNCYTIYGTKYTYTSVYENYLS